MIESHKRAALPVSNLLLPGLIFLFFQQAAYAQNDVTEALAPAESLGCISNEQSMKLTGWLSRLPESESSQALKAAAECYQCLLQKKAVPQSYDSFRRILKERLYSRVPSDQMCLRDRLVRAVIDLRIIQDRPEGQEIDAASLDGALNDFLAGYYACGSVHRNPEVPASVRIARDWCLDPKQPWPPYEFMREFIDNLVAIAAEEPGQGRHLGSVLSAVLQEAMSLKLDAREMREASDAQAILIEPDHGNLAGTSHWFLFRKQLAGIASKSNRIDSGQIQNLILASKDMQGRLELYAGRLQQRSNAGKPFEEYSDLLYGWAEQTSSSERKLREELIRQACRALRRGIELSSVPEAEWLTQNRQKLLERVRGFGLELGKRRRYREVLEFESAFLDPTFKTLTTDQQCYLHAHLAQAHYALGEIRDAMEAFGNSCGKLSIQDLTGMR
jgi:hypothetical protein